MSQPADNNYLLGMDAHSLKRYQLFNEIYQPATEEGFVQLPMRPDMKILEVGCGIGETVFYMAKKIVPQGHVIAFDQSEALVEIAMHKAVELGIENVTFFRAKVQETIFDSESFDLVHTRYVLTYLPDATQIIEKIYSVLKPGGILFCEEVCQSYIKHKAPTWFDQFTSWFAELIEAGGGCASYGSEQLPSDILEAGFNNLSIRGFTPVQNQQAILKTFQLALSHEMKENLINNHIATAEQIDHVISVMNTLNPEALISSSMVVQATGIK